ncbi:serine/threonine-protein kinase PBL27-like, partial [Prosopis cineraria]|uniref:serine/threonine-protein kinase PBL27-like n=1 Tax=Prosopis cineraria TaxID=364024 RepID=UPI00240FCA31
LDRNHDPTLLGMAILLKCCGGSGSYATKQPRTPIEDLCHRFSLTQLGKSTDNFDKTRKIGEGPCGEEYTRLSSLSEEEQPSTTVEELCHRFSLSQLEEATNNFHPTRMIGEGAFGPVYRGGRISIDGQSIEIAVKRIPPGNSFQGRSEFENEIVMMCQLHHPNLVSLVGFCDDKNEMIVVYKYVPNNSLYYQLYEQHGKSSPVEPWKKRLEISIGVARALQLPSLRNQTHHHSSQCRTGREWEYDEGIIDPRLEGQIAPQCWRLYMDIIESCLSVDPHERPDMGDVEVQLERLLQLQEEADHANHGFYSFLI